MKTLARERTIVRLLAILAVALALGLAAQVSLAAPANGLAAKRSVPPLSKPLSAPADIEVDEAGTFYVSDWGYHRILKFSPQGKHLAQILAPKGLKLPPIYLNGARFTGFLPEFLALDRQGSLWATANRSQVLEYSRAGKLVAHWRLPGAHGIALDGQGNVYVSLWSDTPAVNGGIVKLSPAGKKLIRWDTIAHLPGSLHYLSGLQVDGAGNVYVADVTTARIEKLRADGTLLITIGPDITGYRVPARNAPGTFVNTLGCACDVELDHEGNIYINAGGDHSLVKLSPAGSFVRTYPNGQTGGNAAIDAAGNIYIASGNIVKLSPSGQVLAEWK
jgi:streptogramin lyase